MRFFAKASQRHDLLHRWAGQTRFVAITAEVLQLVDVHAANAVRARIKFNFL